MPRHHDLDIYQGATFAFTYTYKDSAGAAIDLTGYTARMSVKHDLVDSDSVFLSTGGDADGGTITLGGDAGTIALAMTAAQTDAMDETGWFLFLLGSEPMLPIDRVIEFMYDLEIESSTGVVTRVLEGKVAFFRAVTTAR